MCPTEQAVVNEVELSAQRHSLAEFVIDSTTFCKSERRVRIGDRTAGVSLVSDAQQDLCKGGVSPQRLEDSRSEQQIMSAGVEVKRSCSGRTAGADAVQSVGAVMPI